MPIITIGSQIIDFPESGSSPDWSQGVIDFAQAVAEQLNAISNNSDVLPDEFILDSYNGSSNVAINGLILDPTAVQGAKIKYSVSRLRDSVEYSEYGEIFVIYVSSNPITQKWIMSREYTGDSRISFTIDDSGQMNISLTSISGTGAHTGKLQFSASTTPQ